MMYDAYQAYADLSHQVRTLASSSNRILSHWSASQYASPLRRMAAYYELVALAGFTHTRPDYAIGEVTTDSGESLRVMEKEILATPFCGLRRFTREGGENEPRVLLVAPMSGHFATLLRGTIRTLLRHHQVYVTDWRNVRDVPLELGPFGFEDFVQHLIDFIKFLGPQAHVVAVCQPAVPALAAVAAMSQADDPDQPASLTLMAGPIDTRIAPTRVNELATSKPIEWFRDKMIGVAPRPLRGAGRRVYPGFLQLAAFMSMNTERHSKAFVDLFKSRVEGDFEKANQIRAFYEEYFAIMDLDADFYLETVELVFQKHALPEGKLSFRRQLIEPRAIKKTFLLTVEGERDDICAVGQTLAAHDLCTGLRPYMKSHRLQQDVGHYGVFSGRRWDTQIYPVLHDHIYSSL
jgi:poly(3-hydroxybutyrate) depolymerase